MTTDERNPSLTGIILASGHSRRFGREDKLTARFKGRPLWQWAVRAMLASRVGRVVLVCRAELAETARRNFNGRLTVVVNEQASEGQSAAMKVGLSALTDEAAGAIYLLADQPLVTPGLLNRLVDAAEAGVELAIVRDRGILRPPTLFGRRHFPALARLTGDTGGREIIKAAGDEIRLIEPEFVGQTADIDLPQDLLILEGLEPSHET